MRFCFFSFLLLFLAVSAFAQGGLNDPILGFWQTQDRDGVVEIYSCADSYCGRFVWLEEDDANNPSLDDKNVNPDLRKRPLCGMEFVGGFKKTADNLYKDGWIYSPRHGSKFGAEIRVDDNNTLVLRGYFFLPVLGGEQVWQRVQKPEFCWNLKDLTQNKNGSK